MRSLAYSAIFLFSLTLLSPTAIVCQSSVDSDTAELSQLERIWNESHQRGDADALDALWADDLEVAVPKMPVMQKADVLKFARSGRMKFLRYQTSDTHIRLYGDAAAVTGRLQRTRVMNGQQILDDWRFTKAYIRRGGHWKVVSFHASEAAQPYRASSTSDMTMITNQRMVIQITSASINVDYNRTMPQALGISDWLPLATAGCTLTGLACGKFYGLARRIEGGAGKPIVQRLCGT